MEIEYTISATIGAIAMQSNNLPEKGFVRIHQVLAVFPISKSAWWAGVKSGEYPASVHLSRRTTAWKAEDIRALIERVANDAKGA